MKTGVNISFTNTKTGVASSSDGVALLVVHAVAVDGKFELSKLYTLTQLSDTTNLGITASYDATNSVSVYRQIAEFYQGAGDGALLYVIGVDKSSMLSTYVASAEFISLLRSTAINSDGSPSPARRAKMIGVVFTPQSEAPTGDFLDDVIPTGTALETTLGTLWDAGFRAFAILDGNNMKSVQNAPDFSSQSLTRVAISTTTATHDSCASVGLPLGILARQAVNYELNNVSAGSLPVQNAWFTDGTPVSSVINLFGTLGEKQHLFIRTRETRAGYYYNDSATASDPTMALSTIPANRVLNKVADYLQEYLTGIIGLTPPVDEGGDIPSGYLSTLEETFKTSYVDTLVNAGEVAVVDTIITNDSPFTSTRTIDAALSILQRPGVAVINANIKFVTGL